MNKLKLRDAKRLLSSKVYVLVTEDETILHGEFPDNVSESLKDTTLKKVRDQLNKLIKEAAKPKKTNPTSSK